jgi:hypothetical protein
MATATPAEGTSFDIHVRGNVTGKTWDGTFRAKPLLTFRDQLNVDKLRRDLVGPNSDGAAPEAFSTAVILAELAFRLTETPEWWKESKGGLDLCDPNVVEEVYKRVKDIETGHLKKVEDEGKSALAGIVAVAAKG